MSTTMADAWLLTAFSPQDRPSPPRLFIIVSIAVVVTAISISISTSSGSLHPAPRLVTGDTRYLVMVVIVCLNTSTRVQQVC